MRTKAIRISDEPILQTTVCANDVDWRRAEITESVPQLTYQFRTDSLGEIPGTIVTPLTVKHDNHSVKLSQRRDPNYRQ
jgi:hypothetical protein